jgi:hypothetical protein
VPVKKVVKKRPADASGASAASAPAAAAASAGAPGRHPLEPADVFGDDDELDDDFDVPSFLK